MTEQEVLAAIREVRVRVEGRSRSVAAADLMPLVHARDRAEAKAALIGTVNPRLPGLGNSVIQFVKRRIARALNWLVREQIEFNRSAMECVHASLEALNETNRALAALEQRCAQIGEQHEKADIHVLKGVAQLHASFKLKVEELEASYRDLAERQHREFAEESAKTASGLREEFERLIHAELRLIRQRSAIRDAGTTPARASGPMAEHAPLDWLRFAEQFRGPEQRVKEHQKRWTARFADAANVLDLGCGRGEFLEIAQAAGIEARGVDQSGECVALCRSKGLAAEQCDLFAYLEAQAEGSLDGIFCAHVIEHLDPARLAGLAALIGTKTRAGGQVILETPDPECPETMAAHFWADPTHVRPVPAALLKFYLEEAGFGAVEVERMGGDYAVIAKKLSIARPGGRAG